MDLQAPGKKPGYVETIKIQPHSPFEEIMKSTYLETLKGQFLIAMPKLTDPNFYRTVTCVCEHTAQGALGIVVNRVHSYLTVKQIFEEFNLPAVSGTERTPVYIGGPVHMNEVFVLHGPPFGWNGCLNVTPSLAMSNTNDVIEAISKGEGPQSYIFCLGCAGWGPGQIEDEMKQNSWLTCDVTEEIIFRVSKENRWDAALKTVGVDPLLLSDSAGRA
ncbi:MAG: YqgE/AlgH family protein [Desulfobacterales bacterium]|nr:YqgE/AlgH family protein [Desulfobacterales bacterium]MDD4071815.1 YqgE/AlgH family protein [Desulfobacterales bacterium]MDD4393387.1 YqgE/AlgH family protein [Desulfobacterales bacterium]